MEKKDNTGVLFSNSKSNPKQPDYKGSAKIGSIEYFLAAWKQTSKSGNEYFSLVFEEAQKKDITRGMVKPDFKGKHEPFIDDELPF